MFNANCRTGAVGAASRYGSGFDQMMWLWLLNTAPWKLFRGVIDTTGMVLAVPLNRGNSLSLRIRSHMRNG
jgi:hypothetical protein